MIIFGQLTVVAGGLKLNEWSPTTINPPTIVYFVIFVLIVIVAEGFN